MQLADFLDCDAIKTSLPGGNKRSLLQQLANLAASGSASMPAAIIAALNEREQLGSTGFGQGVAIPHAKIDGLTQIYALFARLGEPVDYKAIDGRPVDLVFLLLSPPGRGRRASEGPGGDQPGHARRRDARTLARRTQPRCACRGADGRRRAGSHLSSDRLPTHVEVAGILRRVAADGGFGTVMRKGDEERGSLLLFVSSRGRHVATLERILNLDGSYQLAARRARRIGRFRGNRGFPRQAGTLRRGFMGDRTGYRGPRTVHR